MLEELLELELVLDELVELEEVDPELDEEELEDEELDELDVHPEVQPDELIPDEPDVEEPPHIGEAKTITSTKDIFENRFTTTSCVFYSFALPLNGRTVQGESTPYS